MTLYSCLAHVINLATQALISTYSRAVHFDPKYPEAHIPTSRDEVGLVMVRAIVVKVHFSHLYIGMNINFYSGAVIVKTKRNVEDCSV